LREIEDKGEGGKLWVIMQPRPAFKDVPQAGNGILFDLGIVGKMK
jgi:hypothetical protein